MGSAIVGLWDHARRHHRKLNMIEQERLDSMDRDELVAEVKRLRQMYEETMHHLDLMIGAFGIEALVEMVGDEN